MLAVLTAAAIASAGALALGVQEAIVPLVVAAISAGPMWVTTLRGQKDVRDRLDRQEQHLQQLDVKLEAHRQVHYTLWPGLPEQDED